MTASEPALSSSRKRRARRVLGWIAGVTLCLAIAAVVLRAVLIRQMRWPRLTIAQQGCVTAVSVTPDGRTIFSGEGPAYDLPYFVQNQPRDVFVWSAADGRLIRRLSGFHRIVSTVTASPDGRHLIASGEVQWSIAGTTSFGTSFPTLNWDWQRGQVQWRIEGGLPLSYSPDGRLVGCESGIHNAGSGKLIRRTSNHIDEGGQNEFTSDGKLFGIIDAGDLDPITTKQPDDNGKLYYSTTRLHFWRTDTGKEAKDFPFIRVRAFDIARNGQWLVMTSDADDGGFGRTDGSVVRRVDFNTGKVVWTRERRMNGTNADPEAVLNSVALSPDGKYVVLASINSHIIVLDAQTGRELFRPFLPPGTTIPNWALPGGLAFSADDKTLVSRCGRRVLVWDASSLQ